MPPPPGLKIDVGYIAAEMAAQPDVTVGGTVHLGEMIVSANGVSQTGGTHMKFCPDDVSVCDAGFLGRGSSGSVRKVRRVGTNSFMALKEIRVTSQSHLQEIRRELETLHVQHVDLKCPYLVDFYGAYSQEGCVYIAMECMDGSLADLAAVPPLQVLAAMTKDLLKGLVYLHFERRLIHRDLKPGNILFNVETGCTKISDFGVSSSLDQYNGSAHTFVGTVTYMSPERLKGEPYSYAGDIWSLGISLAELFTGCHPYASLTAGGEGSETKFWKLMQHLNSEDDRPAIDFPEEMPPMLKDFIQQCLIKDPVKRPSARDLLEHPLITAMASGDDAACHATVRNWLLEISEKKKLQQQQQQLQQQHQPVQQVTPSKALDLDNALSRLVDMKKR